ncbi:hypothetical protein [Candidatus Symbiopectobacterium sp.]|uniref:hypothetical protein n=1 Tax=Candidatus Symbiopectobacterium sp. TaxID=2816440 RepID=UPI0025BC162C|nr:hypothetical protein [Candidatus Symbiopectobacterium sp.]
MVICSDDYPKVLFIQQSHEEWLKRSSRNSKKTPHRKVGGFLLGGKNYRREWSMSYSIKSCFSPAASGK